LNPTKAWNSAQTPNGDIADDRDSEIHKYTYPFPFFCVAGNGIQALEHGRQAHTTEYVPSTPPTFKMHLTLGTSIASTLTQKRILFIVAINTEI
jgi:hypothetical protein